MQHAGERLITLTRHGLRREAGTYGDPGDAAPVPHVGVHAQMFAALIVKQRIKALELHVPPSVAFGEYAKAALTMDTAMVIVLRPVLHSGRCPNRF